MDDKPLVVLEIANNHQGDLEHGKKIVKGFGDVCENFNKNFEFIIKFQYRDLKTFIHPEYVKSDLKYVRRFLDTQLTNEEWLDLITTSRTSGFKLMCTPFDEKSVTKVVDDGFDILKIASASFDDWPLLEEVVKTDMPIIASVGGASEEKIKRFYTFMKNRNKKFSLNYCVSTYPTKLYDLNLSYIGYMRNLFPDIKIGFSTHEGNDSALTGALAYAQGARIFEKHIALEDKVKGYSINDYSCQPKDLEEWLQNLANSVEIVGSVENRNKYLDLEVDALKSLKRGAYALNKINENSLIDEKDLYFAIPNEDSQLLANDISKFNLISSNESINVDSPVHTSDLNIEDNKKNLEVIRDSVAKMLYESNIYYLKKSTLEISCHYGIDDFHTTGCTLITLMNEKYCKKLIIMLAGQNNPEHFHKKKDESFIVIKGDLEVIVDSKIHNLSPGDILHIPIMSKHSFSTKNGAVFEEISTTHYKDDSHYSDTEISTNEDRKFYIPLM